MWGLRLIILYYIMEICLVDLKHSHQKKKSVCGGNHEVMDRLIYFMVGTLSQPVCAYNSPPPPIHRYTFQDPRGGA